MSIQTIKSDLGNAVALSDVGMVRSENQDAFAMWEASARGGLPTRLLCVAVADGMGGHQGGSTASRETLLVVKENLSSIDERSVAAHVQASLENANRHVHKLGHQNPELQGMGTTCTLAVITPGELYLGHIGDSRCYEIAEDHISQLSKDHLYVLELLERGALTKEQAANHPDQNVLSRALGTRPSVEVDVSKRIIDPNSTLLFCSDGLYNYLSDSEIRSIVIQNDHQTAIQKLIDLAKERGGADNITVILLALDKDALRSTAEDQKDRYETRQVAAPHSATRKMNIDPEKLNPTNAIDRRDVLKKRVIVILAVLALITALLLGMTFLYYKDKQSSSASNKSVPEDAIAPDKSEHDIDPPTPEPTLQSIKKENQGNECPMPDLQRSNKEANATAILHFGPDDVNFDQYDVYIDGARIHSKKIEKFPGSYDIKVKLDDETICEYKIELAAGDKREIQLPRFSPKKVTQQLTTKLPDVKPDTGSVADPVKAKKGKLNITINGCACKILFKGNRIDDTFPRKMDPGTHKFKFIVNDNFGYTFDKDIEIIAGQTNDVEIKLHKVTIASPGNQNSKNFEIHINERLVEYAPIVGICLPTGEYNISAIGTKSYTISKRIIEQDCTINEWDSGSP
ncbi:MAG: hypothetical protein B6244_14250 [Candidatus Cloacimonetes bacterium 4572_55]|nr:MAG: hypothetical protein B6244_14250 [Candidatus Cloacimonetes bacterium 4572_55]